MTSVGSTDSGKRLDLHDPRPDVMKQLTKLLKEARKVGDMADALEFHIKHGLHPQNLQSDNRGADIHVASDQGKNQKDGELLRRLADSGTESIAMRRHADGSATVRIGDSENLKLPPTLVSLLIILCDPGGPSDDDLVGWKTIQQVAILLGEKTGRQIKRHAVSQAIYRLKENLTAAGVNRYLVQTNKQDGAYRFALKRNSVPVIE